MNWLIDIKYVSIFVPKAPIIAEKERVGSHNKQDHRLIQQAATHGVYQHLNTFLFTSWFIIVSIKLNERTFLLRRHAHQRPHGSWEKICRRVLTALYIFLLVWVDSGILFESHTVCLSVSTSDRSIDRSFAHQNLAHFRLFLMIIRPPTLSTTSSFPSAFRHWLNQFSGNQTRHVLWNVAHSI